MGRPKAELRVGGKPILAHLLNRWQWDGPTLLVTAPGRERPPGAEHFDREVIDPVAGEGPMRGLITALKATRTQILIVASCDMPTVESLHLRWLADALARRPTAHLLLLSHGGTTQPFPLALRRDALPALTDHFAGGKRSLRSLLEIERAAQLAAPAEWSPDVWTNLNAPQDLEAFARRAAQS